MQPNLAGICTVTDPALSPDGTRVAVTVSTINTDDDRYDRRIWLGDGSGVEPFTAGPADSAARFSPDGATVAFLRAVDGVAQLATIAVDGGEARVLTNFDCGVISPPVWSPDGSTVAVTAVNWVEEWADLDEEERARRPRRIATRNYRGDGLGWIHDKERRVWLVDVATGEVRRATTGDASEGAPAFSPDGAKIALLVEDEKRAGFRPGASVWEVDNHNGTASEVAPFGFWEKLSYRPDGVLHALGSAGEDFPEPAMLWKLGTEPEVVNAAMDRAVHSFAAGPPNLVWDGPTAVVNVVDSGAAGTVRIGPDGTPEDLQIGEYVVTGFDFTAGTLARVVSTVDHPGRLVVTGDAMAFEQSDFGGVVPPTIEPEHFVVEGPGGDLDVWVYLPPGEDKVPLLLNIHGGPAGQYGWGFFDEFAVYATAGYGVVATNPRGSAGRDRDFLRAVMGDGWGRVDTEDVDAVVAAALGRFDRLDGERLGVMGGSYGGFLTAWLIAHQDRWKVAVVERALLSWPSFAGTSDIGGWFGDRYIGDPDLAWERSPLRVADRITTPTLILHSEADFRCPIEQAEQFFNVLSGNGVETEFVRFPGEGHELSRSGKPRHRQERFEIILSWLDRL